MEKLRLTKDIMELVEHWHLKPLLKALQALRGVRVTDGGHPRGRAR
jgi:hypothetical protein